MNSQGKILPPHEMTKLALEFKRQGKKVVLCHGHYNVIHPGHLRFLRFAKSKGDILIASVLSDEMLPQESGESFFTQDERAAGIAGLEVVSFVVKLNQNVSQFILELAPDYYIKGREFEGKREFIQDEIDAVNSGGGEVIFSSGDLQYSDMLLSGSGELQKETKKEEFLAVCKKYSIDLAYIERSIDTFENLNFLVIGDTIVDQFISCDTLGVSSEAPVLAIRELSSQQYLGGAGIISKHLQSLGAGVSYISVVGQDDVADFVRDDLDSSGVVYSLIEDIDRPTTFKIRYMVGDQKLLRVSRLKQHNVNAKIESRILGEIERYADNVDAIILSDFVYGVITDRVLSFIQKVCAEKEIKLFGDLQCSSQVGDVSKFKNFDLITPTEKEARIALGDQTSGLEKLARNLLRETNCKNLAITLGAQGVLNYSSQNETQKTSEFFPALEGHPLDVAGAGDTMLSGYALALTSGLNIFEASALGSCLAAITVSRIGNIPIQKTELKAYLHKLSGNDIRSSL